jgi:hypothetical protein
MNPANHPSRTPKRSNPIFALCELLIYIKMFLQEFGHPQEPPLAARHLEFRALSRIEALTRFSNPIAYPENREESSC